MDNALSNEAREACVNLRKNEARDVFISGLNKKLELLVKSQKPDSLERAIALALNEEQNKKQSVIFINSKTLTILLIVSVPLTTKQDILHPIADIITINILGDPVIIIG